MHNDIGTLGQCTGTHIIHNNLVGYQTFVYIKQMYDKHNMCIKKYKINKKMKIIKYFQLYCYSHEIEK